MRTLEPWAGKNKRKRDGSEDLLSVMKKIVILYNKMDVTAPYATNELLSSSIYDSNDTNSAFL